MDAGVMIKCVSAKMASTPTQDSAFLRLPLEIRCEIYNHLIHTDDTRVLSMDGACGPTSGLRPVTNLLGVSQQIRTEVHDMIAAITTLQMKACESAHSKIKPRYIVAGIVQRHFDAAISDYKMAKKSCGPGNPEAKRDALAGLSKDEKKAPHELKFWKVCVLVGGLWTPTCRAVDIDFRARVVCVYNLLSEESSNDPCANHWLTNKEAFTNAMRFFTEQDGFEGITVECMSLFLDKVALGLGQPDPEQ